ncbi:LysR family transcriptional regulator [Umezawaea beigongshangensis]|uniref:LysR family transcriptional regulator n=1 Tax=Umezawaea beigongshangensis TaxID=2780383 RepID=UPI0018F1AF3C|nr:LysR family transcriptional regulator [Umezawaea beigongshangensis]
MAELDLGSVRAFVAVADNRHFGEAAAGLGITQQAVSKRIAKLESTVGSVLLSRLRAGTGLSRAGEVFLPHARALLATADHALAVLSGRDRPLRVDVLDTRLAAAELVREFYEATDESDIDVITSTGLKAARAALRTGTVDAAFARLTGSLAEDGLQSIPAHLEPAQVLVGTGHPLAGRGQVSMAELAGATAWMPGNAPDTEWAEFWDAVSVAFGVRIDTTGPNFGYEHFIGGIAASTDHIGFIGEQCRVPDHPGVVRLAVTPPRPAYPWSLLWHPDNEHALLPQLIEHVRAGFRSHDVDGVWLPEADRAAFLG